MKVTISPVGSLIDATTAASTINADLTAIQTAMENTLSRDGTTPNTMNANLDMNSNRILNLPAPVAPTDPVRFQDLSTTGGNLANLGTMSLQNASAVNITGGTVGSAVTGTTQSPGDNTTKLATTAYVAANSASGVSSVGTKTGAITVRGGALPANELTVPRFDAAQTLSAGEIAQGLANTGTVGYTAAQTITLAQQKQTRANLGGLAAEMFTQTETGSVSSPMITRVNETLFASDFGAVGDDTTNDYTALQSFLNAVATSGKEGRLDPSKKYFVSGNDLLLGQSAGVMNTRLVGMGAQIRTDPTQARTGLIVQRSSAVTRADETRKIIVEGLRISQYQDANAVWGFNIVGSTFVTLRDCTVICGADNATVPYVNYGAYYFNLSNPIDPNTGSFWCTMDNCAVKGAVTPSPVGLRIDGQCNAFKCLNTTFANTTVGILFARPSLGLNVNEASIANGVRIDGCDFEGGTSAIGFVGTPSFSSVAGLTMVNNRAESLTNFFDYTGVDINHPVGPAPILGFNYSTATNLITNPHTLTVKQVTVA